MIYQGVLRQGIGPTANKVLPRSFMGGPPYANADPAEFLFILAPAGQERTFNPIIELHSGFVAGENASIVWTHGENTQNDTLTPSFTFDAIGQIQLEVTPWSALKTISAGYDHADSGSTSIPDTPTQYISEIQNIFLANSLEILCISYSAITNGNSFATVPLATLEAYGGALTSIIPPSTIKRLCVEGCALESLDVSGCPLLEDLRAAENEMETLTFGNTQFPNLWHICVRQNLLTSLRTTNFPALDDLWIWSNAGLTGTLTVDSDAIESIDANDCGYTGLDLSGVSTARVNVKIGMARNALTSIVLGSNSIEQIHVDGNSSLETIDLTGQTHILHFTGDSCAFTEETVDHILHTLDEAGIASDDPGIFDGVSVDLNGGLNLPPSAAGMAHAASLAGKGWTVAYNTSEVPTALFENMEDVTLAAGLSLVNPASLLTLPSTAWKYKDSASMRVNLNGIAAEHYMQFDLASGAFSAGFAYKAISYPAGEYYQRVFEVDNPANGAYYRTRIIDQANSGEGWRRIAAWIYGNTYILDDIVNGQEVRFAISYTPNGSHQIRMYDLATDTLLGTATNTNPESATPAWFRIGALGSVVNVNSVMYFDHLRLDYGTTSHPILV